MNKILCIFIDSLPYAFIDEMEFINSLPLIKPLQPGFGYSVNIKAELYCGVRPDDLGFWNEWTYCKDLTLPSVRIPKLLTYKSNRIIGIDRALHVALRTIGVAKANIPFPYQHLFKRVGKSIYSDDFPIKPIFRNIDNLAMCISEFEDAKSWNKDAMAYNKAKKAIAQGKNIFLSLDELDGITHTFGVGSEEHLSRIRQLDIWIQDLYADFNTQYGDSGYIFVFSDHGMANVQRRIQMTPEKYFGYVCHETYVYFLDSTIMRVWCENERLANSIGDWLSNLDCGQLISEITRREYGLASPSFGKHIFVLHEGNEFGPSFLGNKLAKAMHGYSPMCDSQQGFLGTSVPLNVATSNIVKSTDLHKYLTEYLWGDEYVK